MTTKPDGMARFRNDIFAGEAPCRLTGRMRDGPFLVFSDDPAGIIP
jgi:hypothetical protein